MLDVDECSTKAHSCDGNANCVDTEGSYECTCKDGFHGNGKQCTGNYLIRTNFRGNLISRKTAFAKGLMKVRHSGTRQPSVRSNIKLHLITFSLYSRGRAPMKPCRMGVA